MKTFVVIYKSSLHGGEMETTVPAKDKQSAEDMVRRCCSVEIIINSYQKY